VIWLTEVAPKHQAGKRFIEHLANANAEANPNLPRLALKLATGAGKTTVMAMLIAWQTLNAVRHPGSKRFTRGFLVVTPGITIRDRLRVLKPNDPDSYYASRELVPADMLEELNRAKIVITNYHAFKRRERLDPPRRVIHYERQRPGELLQVDTKKLGRIGGVGHRIHRDRSRRSRGVGWEYLHACVDDATRMSYTEVLSDERGETCAGFIRWAVAWFQAQGIRVERVMTNNGAGYPVPGSSARRCASRASATCVRARTRPGPTGRSNASFRPPCASGRTPSPTHHRGCGSRP